MKDMTQKAALAEAFRLWGTCGTIQFRPSRRNRTQRGRLARYCCVVSNGHGGPLYPVVGQGNTWREAFADAATILHASP